MTSISFPSTRTSLRGTLAFAAALTVAVGVTISEPARSSAPNEIYVNVGSGELGDYLVGPKGMTLYVHAEDIYTGQSRCHGVCADAWPPLLIRDGFTFEAGEGVTGTVSLTPRPDRTRQLTYRGRPVYYHARDEAVGDVMGHGAGGVWFVALLDGSSPPVPMDDGAAAAEAPQVTLQVANDELGAYLTDDTGMTLYFFADDWVPGNSRCTEGCLEAWPPLTVGGHGEIAAGEGVTGVVGIAPGEGQHLVTYDGRPLYYFAGDAAPGDTNGHGTNDAWFVATVDGTLPTS